jgi:Sedlin, N-terminal conserved region
MSLILAVAIVGKSNNLRYFKTFGVDDMIKLQMAIYGSLDILDERAAERANALSTNSANKQQQGGQQGGDKSQLGNAKFDSFLGLLCIVQDYKIFGYISGANVKIIIAIKDVLLKEDKVRSLFTSLHNSYLHAVSNPFADFDSKISSPTFEQEVFALVTTSASQIEYKGPLPF